MKTKIKILLIIITLFGFSKVKAFTADVEMKLETAKNVGDELEIDIKLINPSEQKLVSIRSWLSYDPTKLEGIEIKTYEDFDLVAPGEKVFDKDNKRVKIGLANSLGGVSVRETVIATVKFKVLASDDIKLDFYDYQISELGHTNANIIEDNLPINVLKESPEGIRITGTGVPVGGEPKSVKKQENIEMLGIPEGLKITTGPNYAELMWDKKDGLGYNIYYSNQSGYYMHMIDAGGLDTYHVTGLNDEETYYFAIKSYDIKGNESPYSDEVAIVINHPETSTAPLNKVIAGSHLTKNGPSMIIFMVGVSGVIGYLLINKNKLLNK